MALVLSSDTARLVHADDPSVELGLVAASGWIPEGKVAKCDGATVVEVRPMTGVEFAKASASEDSASELAYILSTCVVSVDGDKKKAAEVAKWPWHLAHPLRQALVHLSLGGELPFVPAPESEEPETE
ncbi:MAG: hypothetical protein H6747_09595 [Deltaproteobacteria bacterium]|nr:hypothetical protein [Deltaproteobacteria bacterium]